MPTKIDVSEPLIVFFEDVAAPLVAAEGQRRRARLRRGAGGDALARLDVRHHVGERIDRLFLGVRGGTGTAGASAGAFRLQLGDDVADRVDDLRAVFRTPAADARPAPPGLPACRASMSAPMNDGGA